MPWFLRLQLEFIRQHLLNSCRRLAACVIVILSVCLYNFYFSVHVVAFDKVIAVSTLNVLGLFESNVQFT